MSAQPDPQERCAELPLQASASLPLRTAADPDPLAGVTLFEALQAKGLTVGMVVQSTAGHDYSRLGIVIALRPPFALVADGRHRPVARPKKKRLSHLRPVVQADPEALAQALTLPEEGQRDSAVRRLIREATGPFQAAAIRTADPARTEPQPDQAL